MWSRFQVGSHIPLPNRTAMMLCTVSLPRKWSIRKNWLSSACCRIRAFNARADGRSDPNGFSITTRRNTPSFCCSNPALPSPSITVPKNRAATAQ